MAVSETVRKFYAIFDESDMNIKGLDKFGNKVVQIFESRADRDAFIKDNYSNAMLLPSSLAMKTIKDDVKAWSMRGMDVSRASYSNDDWIAEYCQMLGSYGLDVYMRKEDDYRHM